MYPRQSATTHTEQLGDEASVYDWARAQVHALNPTAACVWRQCDGATSPDAMAAALRAEMGIAEAEAVVDLTLRQLARLHLLELPVESRGDQPATTRRWLLHRGVAAAMLPVIYSIVAPSPRGSAVAGGGADADERDAESRQPGHHGGGHADGHQFRRGQHDGGRQRCRRDGQDCRRGQHDVTDRQLRGRCGSHGRCPHGDGHDGQRDQRWANLHDHAAGVGRADADQHRAESGHPGHHAGGHSDGHQLRRRRHDRECQWGSGVTVGSVVVSSSTSLSANFVLDFTGSGPRSVTVTTAAGTSGAQTFTVSVPALGAPTLISLSPNQGIQGTTAAVTLTGTNFVVGATTVTIGGSGVTATNVTVGSRTSLTASFVLDPTAATGARTVTVTTAAGTSGAQTFTVNLPAPGARR